MPVEYLGPAAAGAAQTRRGKAVALRHDTRLTGCVPNKQGQLSRYQYDSLCCTEQKRIPFRILTIPLRSHAKLIHFTFAMTPQQA